LLRRKPDTGLGEAEKAELRSLLAGGGSAPS
jgi:hypothetical protein